MKSPSMQTRLVLSLAIAGVWAGGCDDRSAAEKDVLEKLASARSEIAKVDASAVATDPSLLDKAKNDYLAAAKNQAAGPALQASSYAAAGAVALQAADAARLELINRETAVRQTLGELRSLAQQVALLNYFTAGLQQRDPKSAIAAVGKQTGQLQGDGQAATWSAGSVQQLPTLSGLKQRVSQLETQIADRKNQLADLDKQRLTAVSEAETKFAAADKMKGDEGVAAFTDAAESRRRGEELALQIDLQQDQLARLEADLAVAKGEQAALEKGVAALQEQSKEIQSTWSELGGAIEKNKAAAKALASGGGGEGSAGPSAADKAQLLTTQLKAVADQREVVTRLLDDADTQYNAALTAAKSLEGSIREQMNAPTTGAASYKSLREVMHPNRFQLMLGAVQREQGAVLSSEATLLSDIERTRGTLQKELDAAGLTVPESMTPIEPKTLKDAVDAADEKLKRSLETLTNVQEGDSPKVVKNGAMVSRLVTLQQLIDLQSLRATLGEAAAAGESTSYLSDAQALKGEIVQANLRLPRLPGELGELPPPGAAPAATPAGETPAGETPAAPAASDTDQIRQLQQDLAAATVSYQPGALESLTYTDETTKPVLESAVKYSQACTRLTDAIAKAFPNAAEAYRRGMIDGAKAGAVPIEMIEIRGDEAFVSGNETPVMRRIEGKWKTALSATIPSGKSTVDLQTKMTEVMDGLVTRIEAGEFADANAFGQAMNTAVQATMSEFAQ